MAFTKESDFENALIKMLTESCGWETEGLQYKTEKDLLQNWQISCLKTTAVLTD